MAPTEREAAVMKTQRAEEAADLSRSLNKKQEEDAPGMAH